MGLTGNWDGRISRRALLRTGGSAAAGVVLLGYAGTAQAIPPFQGDPFSLGVASGDPTPDGIVLWTRLAPAPLEGGGLPREPYGVRYELATDEQFKNIVRRGTVEALWEEAHSVHVELGGLLPATEYWYRFKFGTTESVSGRTRTAPALDSTDPTSFAFVSCQNYIWGYYNAYIDIAEQDLDLVVHLGDYIYEGPGLNAARIRDHFPQRELFSLDDYRVRHAQYRTDPDLREAHRRHPFLMTWDDHEFKDNYADLDFDPNVPLETAASAAPPPTWPTGSTQITQCDVTEQLDSGYCPDAVLESRTILGTEQRNWLFEGIEHSSASWNILANQVPFAPHDRDITEARQFNPDKWDGYVADRQAVLTYLREKPLKNTVVITGDSHINSVRNVPPNFESFDGDPVATEFVGTSISTDGDPGTVRTRFSDPDNPHFRFHNNQRGYVRVDLTPTLWTSQFRVVPTIRTHGVAATKLATFVVENGKPGAAVATGVASAV